MSLSLEVDLEDTLLPSRLLREDSRPFVLKREELSEELASTLDAFHLKHF
jgi:hypothetical protein